MGELDKLFHGPGGKPWHSKCWESAQADKEAAKQKAGEKAEDEKPAQAIPVPDWPTKQPVKVPQKTGG